MMLGFTTSLKPLRILILNETVLSRAWPFKYQTTLLKKVQPEFGRMTLQF